MQQADQIVDSYRITFVVPQDLLVDYNRLVVVLKFIHEATKLEKQYGAKAHIVDKFNVRKRLENWFIDLANLPASQTVTKDPVIKSLDINNPLVTDILDKFIKRFNVDIGEKLYNNLRQRMQVFLNNPTLYTLPLVYYNNDKIILVSDDLPEGSYGFDMPAEIYHRLLLAHQMINQGNRYAIDDIYHLMFRYQSIIAYGNQWAVPKNIYAFLYDNGFNYEAFASPINSVMLTLGVLNEKPFYYGSLFKDTDAPFGSHGSFLDLVLPNNGTYRMTINPPFIPEFQNILMSKIYQLLDNKQNKVTMCINLPGELSTFVDFLTSVYYRGGVTLPASQNVFFFKDYIRIANFPATYLFMSNDDSFSVQTAEEYSNFIYDTGTAQATTTNMHNKYVE